MNNSTLRIATRKSPLALWQAEHIKARLLQLHPHLHIELIPLLTQGDKFLETSLDKMGGKGLFVKELENALLTKRADIAVHSIKDMPYRLPEALTLAVIAERADPRDVLLCAQHLDLFALPMHAVVGTSSLRRQAQIKALRPDLVIKNLRGNVDTRIEKLLRGEFTAIILAAAGLQRLEKTTFIRQYFSPDVMLPAIGQGALGIECRRDDHAVLNLIAPLDHQTTRECITAERAMNEQFGGNCHTPIAAYAIVQNQQLQLHGLVAKPDGTLLLRGHGVAHPSQAIQLGQQVAAELFSQGAAEILNHDAEK